MSTTGKTVVITGTSSGIGLATAVAAAAAQAGWRTIATMRDATRSAALEEAAHAAGVSDQIEIRHLDVTDPASIQTCLAGIIADHGRLDAVINNAGTHHIATLEQDTLDDIRAVMELNFYGVVHVTQAALPHLRASGGRVLTISSLGGAMGQPFSEAYNASKFAVEGLMQALAPVAAAVGVQVSVIQPGFVSTPFAAALTASAFAPQVIAAAGPYAPVMSAYGHKVRQTFDAAAQTPEEVATHIIEALNAEQPAFRIHTCERARTIAATALADLDGSQVLALNTATIT